MANYPQNIMARVRQMLELEGNDAKFDEKIANLSKRDILDCCLVWEGIIGYTGTICGWIEDIYGIRLD